MFKQFTLSLSLIGVFSISALGIISVSNAISEEKKALDINYEGKGVISIGEGVRIGNVSLTQECPTGARYVEGATGKVTALDGSERIVPMIVNEGEGAVDMYNDCVKGDDPNYLDKLKTVIVDEDGEVITAHIFGDNYYELYINGKFIARDSISFVPFNSTAVRFKASYPITIAVHMADWETHFGVGMEYDIYNVGDAGFIAKFDNGTITNADWKILPVYIAPLDSLDCLVEDSFGNADASACPIKPKCADNPSACLALHYDLPKNWTQSGFDDSHWKNATLYEADKVTRARGYAGYADKFGDASFIWSPSLKLDNQVLARYVLEKKPSK